MRHLFITFIFILLSIQNSYADKIKVISTILPIASIASFIGGEKIESDFIIKNTGCPHHYSFKPQDMMTLKQADLVIIIDPNFEQFLPSKLNNRIVKLSENFEIKNSNYHIWLSPSSAILMASKIKDELSKIAPKDSEYFNNNFNEFKKQIDLLNAKIKLKLKDAKNNYFVGHDSYFYFEEYYNIKNKGIIFDSQYGLSGQSLENLKKQAKNFDVKCVITDSPIPSAIDNILPKDYKIIYLNSEFDNNYNPSELKEYYLYLLQNAGSKFSECLNN